MDCVCYGRYQRLRRIGAQDDRCGPLANQFMMLFRGFVQQFDWQFVR
jgi:hypothetical protein